MTKYHPVTHVIFDLDGLILDTESVYTQVNSECLSKYGKTFTWELKQRQMGRKHREAIGVLLEATGLADKGVTIDEYAKDYDERLNNLFPSATLMPGAEELIRHLHAHKIPMAVCTSSSADSYKLKVTNHHELMSLFHHVVCCSSDLAVTCGKPSPDGFIVCSHRFNPPPAQPMFVLVFEDAPNGVQAALAALMQVCFVPDPRVTGDSREEATVCLSSLEEFDPKDFGLPPF